MDERDIAIVQRYSDMCQASILDYKNKPIAHGPLKNDIFDELSYSAWAVEEILVRAKEELFKPPPYVGGEDQYDMIDIIVEFAFNMECGMESTTNERNRKIFEIAKNAADDVLYFYASERRNTR